MLSPVLSFQLLALLLSQLFQSCDISCWLVCLHLSCCVVVAGMCCKPPLNKAPLQVVLGMARQVCINIHLTVAA
jgi:hypothetical protein